MKKQTQLLAVMTAAAFLSIMPAMADVSGTGTAYGAEYGWTTEDDSLSYYDEDGYLVTDSWRKNGEDWFYLNEDGQISRSKKIEDYYVDENGKMVKDKWIELRNEEDQDTPESPASYWYYFDKDGKAAASKWIKSGDQWYYFNESGQMQTGKTVIDGSTYYLGKENEGAMKTGWIKLEDDTEAPGMGESWYYFNSDGKMVENQVDKKIDGSYYTFINGKMQTGWVQLPREESTEESAEGAAEGAAVQVSLADDQYYGYETDGKRAEGFRTIEGIKGIHNLDETFTFYFKNGKPHFSTVKGNQLFTVNGKKYAFNDRGEMQTGQKIVNVDNGEIANFYFDEDGVMKTGKQNIYNEDSGETESWFFYTEGDKKGQGYHGLKDNLVYVYGKRQEASSDLKYAPVKLNDTTYLVNSAGSVQKASAASVSSAKPDLGKGHKDFKDANGTTWVVDTNGIVK